VFYIRNKEILIGGVFMTDKEKRTKKYMADQRHRNRLKRAADERRNNSAYWTDEEYFPDGHWEKTENSRAKKVYESSNCERYRYYKRISNRSVRRFGSYIPKGNWYRKIFDYSWAVY
jgi:hypothetical protein